MHIFNKKKNGCSFENNESDCSVIAELKANQETIKSIEKRQTNINIKYQNSEQQLFGSFSDLCITLKHNSKYSETIDDLCKDLKEYIALEKEKLKNEKIADSLKDTLGIK